MSDHSDLIDIIRHNAVPIHDENIVPDEVLSLIGDARLVLIGEETHGTREFYQHRAEITKRLITEKGFSAVAVEAGFSKVQRADRYARHLDGDQTDESPLGNFQNFPLWMWRNETILEFVEWLREHNAEKPSNEQTGFYGIDLYCLYDSIEAVLNSLKKSDSQAFKAAQTRYSCFDHFGKDAQSYGHAAAFDERFSCEDASINQLLELRRRANEFANHADYAVRAEYFFAEQNGLVVKNAESYFRHLFKDKTLSWNLRERHMAESLESLAIHLEEENQAAKIVVWAHNWHAGDARATEMGERGKLSLGQIAREKYKDEIVLLGFTTYSGAITAAGEWGEAAQIKQIKPARVNSYGLIFHNAGIPAFFLNLRGDEVRNALSHPQLMRSIGLIYQPEIEEQYHYLAARLAGQFDGIIHFDQTHAVKPLDDIANRSLHAAPDYYPTGI